MEPEASVALRAAIARAKQRGASEVDPDDVLMGCLLHIARFGIARIGSYIIDLEAFGADWTKPQAPAGGTVAYSEATVALLDRASSIAAADTSSRVTLPHLLAAFVPFSSSGLMAALAESYGITAAGWRAALAELPVPQAAVGGSGSPGNGREFYSPEQAAELLGVHHQTIRGYIRSGKLPALRIAGERAVRIRRESLERLLEPLEGSEPE